MQQTYKIETNITDTPEVSGNGVFFDTNTNHLIASYKDQISTFRAKRAWMMALEENLLLTQGHDFTISVKTDIQSNKHILACNFKTASARYAFWKLTNNQAPEAQYIIETAHIPNSSTRYDEVMSAPDLKNLNQETEIVETKVNLGTVAIFNWLKNFKSN